MKKGEEGIVDTISSWLTKDKVDEAQVERWMEEGRAFWLSPQGTRAMHKAEAHDCMMPKAAFKPSGMRYAADLYVSGGIVDGEEVLVKSTRSTAVHALQNDAISLDYLKARGQAFTNVTSLAVQENVLRRANGIANKMQNDYTMTSPEWRRWVDRTAVHNATSLTQVMAAYYQDYSIGDVGVGGDYVPRAGFPGTLAPGEKFIDNYGIDDMPNRILHPWPAMQAIQWHVRWPPTHPMIPPPLLWLALNDMYTQNFTETQMSTDGSDMIVGGTMMTPKDALHIAREHEFGNSFVPEEQLQHGGSLFDGGFNIPHYNPDHGPTIAPEDSHPPVPDHLLPITTRWLDPLRGLDVDTAKSAAEVETEADEAIEEAVRRAAADRLMGLVLPIGNEGSKGGIDDDNAIISDTEAELAQLISFRHKLLADKGPQVNVHDQAEGMTGDSETLNLVEKLRSEQAAVQAKRLSSTLSGAARPRRNLMRFSIEAIADLREEVSRVEKDSATRKRSGRRRTRKKA